MTEEKKDSVPAEMKDSVPTAKKDSVPTVTITQINGSSASLQSNKIAKIEYFNGKQVQVLDMRDNKWYQCKVVDVNSGAQCVLVHYNRWSSRFDEWINMNSYRIQPSYISMSELELKRQPTISGEKGGNGSEKKFKKKQLEDDSSSSVKKKKSSSVPVLDCNKYAEVPDGWDRTVTMRTGGASAGKFDVYFHSPNGKKLRSRKEIEKYCEENGIVIDISKFQFSHHSSESVSSAVYNTTQAKTDPTTNKTSEHPEGTTTLIKCDDALIYSRVYQPLVLVEELPVGKLVPQRAQITLKRLSSQTVRDRNSNSLNEMTEQQSAVEDPSTSTSSHPEQDVLDDLVEDEMTKHDAEVPPDESATSTRINVGTYVHIESSGKSGPACIVNVQPLSVRYFEPVPGQFSQFQSGDIFNIMYEDIKKIINEPELVSSGSRNVYYRFLDFDF